MGESILKRAKMSGLIRFIIFLVLAVVFFCLILLLGYSFQDVTGNYCEIRTYEDYVECSRKDQYFVKVYSDYVYEAGYEYYDVSTDITLSKFVDFEIPLEGTESYMSLLGVVSVSDLDKMQEQINNGETATYVGHLGELDSSYNEGLFAVVDGYVDYYTGEEFYNEYGFAYTEDEVYNFILPLQVNGYNHTTTSMYIYVAIFGGIGLFFIVLAILAFREFLDPKRNHSFKALTDEDLARADMEYQQGAFSFNEKKFKVSDHFFYILAGPNITIGKLADITDLSIYEVRSRGIVTNRYLRARMASGKVFDIAVKKKDIPRYVEELVKKNPNIDVDPSCEVGRSREKKEKNSDVKEK